MRTLFLLRGLPGAGKSTWIRENHLEPYTISPDQVRTEFQAPLFDEYGNPMISQTNDAEVWNTLMQRLEGRMRRGDFTVIDATHYTHRMLTHYNQLIREYHYRAYIVDFTDVPFETVLERNHTRDPYKRVPEDRLYYMKGVIEDGEFISNKFTVVTCDEASALLKPAPIDWNGKYERIAVFGDIHGCYQPLKEYFEKFPYDEKTLYVFVGDYLDRGIQNKEVLQFLINSMNKKNFLFLEGNHEKWLRLYSKKKQQIPSAEELAVFKKYGIKPSIERIRSEEFIKTEKDIADIDKRDIRIFCSHLAQMAFAKFGSKVYCITHGGIPFAPSIIVPTEQLIKGVGEYETADEVYATWMNNTPNNYITIHGHRNLYEIDTKVTDRIYNLCAPVETGGNLRVLHIGADDSIQAYDICNTVYRHSDNDAPRALPTTDAEWVQAFEASPFVEKKEFKDGICSYNFTKDAFKGRKWNDATVKARGIFVNNATNQIVARAYDKFFNIGEMPETSIQSLHRTLAFPVRAYKKYNGFLGLISWNPVTDELMFCSKSSLDSVHAQIIRKIAIELRLDLDKLKMYCKKNNCTLVCECVAPKEDPHIVPYNENHLVLLDIIFNEFKTRKLPYDDVKFAANLLGMECKELVHTFSNFHEFSEFIRAENSKKDMFAEDEGYVFEDSQGFMAKLKTPSYKFWKGMRWVLWMMKSGKPYNSVVKAAWRKPYIMALKTMHKMKASGSLSEASILDVRSLLTPESPDFSCEERAKF